MKKRKVNSDIFPAPTGPVSWLNQHDVVRKYARYGVTRQFLAYNRSFQFRSQKNTTKELILLVKRSGAATCLYRDDVTHEFVMRTFGSDNVVELEQNANQTPKTPQPHKTKDTQNKIGQKS
jgi:hypothetical protein